MKLGRNKPCWCGSGKKYKKCHLDRETQSGLSLSDGIAALRLCKTGSECVCPPEMRSECNGGPIDSHSLAKSLGLRKLAVKGHVLGLKHDFKTLINTKGKAEIGLIGINKVSVFPGFCSYHDSTIFEAVEREPFRCTAEQCFLLSYRAIARERHAKASGIDINKFLKDADRGRSLPERNCSPGWLREVAETAGI